MLAGLSHRQFLEWRAYAELEPFDEVRDDLRIASIVATLLNVNRGESSAAVSIDDCRLKFGDEGIRKPMAPHNMRALMQAYTRAHNKALAERAAVRDTPAVARRRSPTTQTPTAAQQPLPMGPQPIPVIRRRSR